MPLYEYKCGSCEHTFTEMLKIADRNTPEIQPCPSCKKKKVKQQVGGASIADPFKIGITKPPGEFRERMKQIKDNMKFDKKAKIKDY